jgi:hypothetical protein
LLPSVFYLITYPGINYDEHEFVIFVVIFKGEEALHTEKHTVLLKIPGIA